MPPTIMDSTPFDAPANGGDPVAQEPPPPPASSSSTSPTENRNVHQLNVGKQKNNKRKRGRPLSNKTTNSTMTPSRPAAGVNNPSCPIDVQVVIKRHPLADFKANQLANTSVTDGGQQITAACHASPVPATSSKKRTKSPGHPLLRQLQTDLSPKYTETASNPSAASVRCSRYGRQQKPAEPIDCQANEILDAVRLRSLSDLGSSPPKRVRRATTTVVAATPEAAVAVVTSPSTPLPTSAVVDAAVSSPYVSPIDKLISLNRSVGGRVEATDYDRTRTSSSSSSASKSGGEQNGDAASPRQPIQLSRTSLVFDATPAAEVAAALAPPKPVVQARVPSSGRQPVVPPKVIVSSSSSPPSRRNKILPLAPLFSETGTARTSPTVTVTEPTRPVAAADHFGDDIEATITSFRVHRTPPTAPIKLEMPSKPPLPPVTRPQPAQPPQQQHASRMSATPRVELRAERRVCETPLNIKAEPPEEDAREADATKADDATQVAADAPNEPMPRHPSVDSAKGSSIVSGNDTIGLPPTAWREGQLCWARIGNYPFWPSIACRSPDGRQLQVQTFGRKQTLNKMHIRFLADNGRRSWVNCRDLVAFEGIKDFQRMRAELPANMKQELLRARGFLITMRLMPFWRQAVVEAEMLQAIDVSRRLGVFERTLESERKPDQTSAAKLASDAQRQHSTVAAIDRCMSIGTTASSTQDISFSSVLTAFQNHQRTSTPTAALMAMPAKLERLLGSHANEEPASTKVHSYLQSLPSDNGAAATHDHDDVDYDASAAQLTAIENDSDFIDFYRRMKEHNFGECDRATELHLKQLAMKMWMLKLMRNVEPKAPAPSSKPRLSPTLRKRLASTANSSSTPKDISTGTRRSKRELSHSTTTNSNSSKLVHQQSISSTVSSATMSVTAERNALRAKRHAERELRDIAEMDQYYMRDQPKNTLFRGMLKEPVCRLCLRPDSEFPDHVERLRKCRSTTCHELVHASCAAQLRAGRTAEQIAKAVADPATAAAPEKPNAAATGKKGKKGKRKRQIVLHVAGDGDETALVDEDSDNERSPSTASTVVSIDDPFATDAEVYCPDCWPTRAPVCFVCKSAEYATLANEPLLRCTEKLCGRHFHEPCLKYWPQNKITSGGGKGPATAAANNGLARQLHCPCHVCHQCVSDDPRGKHFHTKSAQLTRCVHCPATYHVDSNCVPAGSILLTAAQLICPRHRVETRRPVNANWCFICAKGGALICCETCPTAFHAECLRVALPERYICEECETGRLPLYGEVVWAKIANCRWWPAVTVPPAEVPANVLAARRRPHEFAVRFFGSRDFSWISRGFVFLYQDGDSECGDAVVPTATEAGGGGQSPMASARPTERLYQKALVQAKQWYERHKRLAEEYRDPEREHQLKPLPYIKCKINRPVAPVRLVEPVADEQQQCNCTEAGDEEGVVCGTNCWNRALQLECDAQTCVAGPKCTNRRFDRREYPALVERRMEGKGWGLVANERIAAGRFIIEYVGELIDRAEFDRRCREKQERKEEHYYFLTLSKTLWIDAGPRGNSARFINHSCEPNCETQVWQVKGNQRVGLFALEDIEPNTELTFNYNLEAIGELKKVCFCGAKRCAGFIGAKYVDPEEKNKKTLAVASKKKLPKSKSKSKATPATKSTAKTAKKRKPSAELDDDSTVDDQLLQPPTKTKRMKLN